VELGHAVGRELDVDHRARDGDDAPFLQLLPAMFGGFGGDAHASRSSASVVAPWRRASAPPTISMISVVMASWRARFMVRVRLVMRSSALSVADFIARCRAACSDAAASRRAANRRDST